MIMVKNMDESIWFYHEILGLPVNKRFGGINRPEIAFLGEGETQIELVCHNEEQNSVIESNLSIGFEVDSVDDLIADLQKKAIPIHDGPYQPSSNLKFFYILDPEGVSVQLVERHS
jgi:lactoylglutathione lyase